MSTFNAHADVNLSVKMRGPGGPEVLQIAEVKPPEIGPRDVVVNVAACGVNRADCLQRQGHYPAPPGYPSHVLGLEFSGTVATVGNKVTSWKSGDRVMGIVGGGAMAQKISVPADELLAIPGDMSFAEAAAVPEAFLTAFDGLEQLDVRAGQWLLIHAVASGVGTAVLQLANWRGARVIGTSRQPEKLQRCANLGLQHPVLVDDAKFADAVKKIASDGVNAVFDLVGGAYVEENLRSLALQGRLLVVGLLAGQTAQIPLGILLRKRAWMGGTVLRSRPAHEKAALVAAFAARAWPGLASKQLRPVLEQVWPMEDVAKAHRFLESNQTFGKIVLTW